MDKISITLSYSIRSLCFFLIPLVATSTVIIPSAFTQDKPLDQQIKELDSKEKVLKNKKSKSLVANRKLKIIMVIGFFSLFLFGGIFILKKSQPDYIPSTEYLRYNSTEHLRYNPNNIAKNISWRIHPNERQKVKEVISELDLQTIFSQKWLKSLFLSFFKNNNTFYKPIKKEFNVAVHIKKYRTLQYEIVTPSTLYGMNENIKPCMHCPMKYKFNNNWGDLMQFSFTPKSPGLYTFWAEDYISIKRNKWLYVEEGTLYKNDVFLFPSKDYAGELESIHMDTTVSRQRKLIYLISRKSLYLFLEERETKDCFKQYLVDINLSDDPDISLHDVIYLTLISNQKQLNSDYGIESVEDDLYKHSKSNNRIKFAQINPLTFQTNLSLSQQLIDVSLPFRHFDQPNHSILLVVPGSGFW